MSKLVMTLEDKAEQFVVVSHRTGGLRVAKTHTDEEGGHYFDPIGEYALYLLLHEKCKNYSDTIKNMAKEAVNQATPEL
jgi:hypothetical protein